MATCLVCPNQVKTAQAKYCSRTCASTHRSDLAAAKWLSGEFNHETTNTVVSLRRYVKRLYGEKCSLCGWAERNSTTGLIPVELDHIDGDSRNNKIENLRILCPNCHSLTPTFRALNRGRGRKKIR